MDLPAKLPAAMSTGEGTPLLPSGGYASAIAVFADWRKRYAAMRRLGYRTHVHTNRGRKCGTAKWRIGSRYCGLRQFADVVHRDVRRHGTTRHGRHATRHSTPAGHNTDTNTPRTPPRGHIMSHAGQPSSFTAAALRCNQEEDDDEEKRKSPGRGRSARRRAHL